MVDVDLAALVKAERLRHAGWERMVTSVVVGPPREDLDGEALEAIRKILRGKQPTPSERHAFVLKIRASRPALLVKDGRIDKADGPLGGLDLWPEARRFLVGALRSVGLIGGPETGEELGTGFMVRPGLVCTNRHVVVALEKLGMDGARITFGHEAGRRRGIGAKILAVEALDPAFDLALVRVGRTSVRIPPLTLCDDAAEAGHQVAAVGYPFPDDDRNPEYGALVVSRPLGVERVSPGLVTDVFGELLHDCTTLGGSSGSPLLALDSGEVVGVHYEGDFLATNRAVPVAAVRKLLATYDEQAGS